MQTKIILSGLLLAAAFTCTTSCSSNQASASESTAPSSEQPAVAGGQSNVQDNESQKNIVQAASGSKDHTTLVAAVKAAELDALSNAGPFTVFAPVNAAFDKLPAGTVESLLKPEKKADLQNILQYHVSIGVFKLDNLHDGQVIGQANGDNIKITVKDGKYFINGNAEIVASIPVSNGLIHVVNEVLLPPTK